jgi:hypothetical protein
MCLRALNLARFAGVEILRPTDIKCAAQSPLGYSVGCFNPPRDWEEDLMGLLPVARTTHLNPRGRHRPNLTAWHASGRSLL